MADQSQKYTGEGNCVEIIEGCLNKKKVQHERDVDQINENKHEATTNLNTVLALVVL